MTSKDHGSTESELEKDELWMNVFHQTTSITAMEFFPLIYWPRALMAIILLQQDKWFKWWHWRYTPWEDSAQRESDIYLRSVSLLFPLITAQQIENVEEICHLTRRNQKPFFLRFWSGIFFSSQQEVIVIINVIKAHDWKCKKFVNCFVLCFFLNFKFPYSNTAKTHIFKNLLTWYLTTYFLHFQSWAVMTLIIKITSCWEKKNSGPKPRKKRFFCFYTLHHMYEYGQMHSEICVTGYPNY